MNTILTRLVEFGKSEHFSGERFNRYKGTEHRLRVVELEGEDFIVGFVREHDDAPESWPVHTHILFPLAEAASLNEAHDSEMDEREAEHLRKKAQGERSSFHRSSWSLFRHRPAQVSKELRLAAEEQGTPVPVCPHCAQVMPRAVH
jgi:hypothetical protein